MREATLSPGRRSEEEEDDEDNLRRGRVAICAYVGANAGEGSVPLTSGMSPYTEDDDDAVGWQCERWRGRAFVGGEG